MTIPCRGDAGVGTYFVTASTLERNCLLQSERMAGLFVDVLFHHRKQGKYQLHEFVVMPNQFHALVTPISPVTLENAIQFIKGGFSYQVKKELGLVGEIWQTSFYHHRVRASEEYARLRRYIHQNSALRGLVTVPEEFPYSSAKLKLDEVPQWLMPAA